MLDWHGQAAAADYAVLTALLNIGQRLKSNRFPVSQRELTEQAGLGSRNTASAALQRLEKRGLVKVDSSSQPQHVWLNLCSIAPVSSSHPRPYIKNGSELLVSHDAFRSSNAMFRIYNIIGQGEPSRGTLVESTGLHRSTVVRNLKRLCSLGLVDEDTNGRFTVNTSADFDEVAQQLGNSGAGERQRERHERERADFQARTNTDCVDVNGWKRRTLASGLIVFVHDPCGLPKTDS